MLYLKIDTLQSLTGKYREIQGKPCNENRDPAMRTGFPCNESRFFPVGIDLQGKAVSCTGFGFTVHPLNKKSLQLYGISIRYYDTSENISSFVLDVDGNWLPLTYFGFTLFYSQPSTSMFIKLFTCTFCFL